MKHLLFALFLIVLFSCQKEQVIQPAPIEVEDIDTIYAYDHVWIGPRKFVDSAYGAFLAEMFPNGNEEFIRWPKYSLK